MCKLCETVYVNDNVKNVCMLKWWASFEFSIIEIFLLFFSAPDGFYHQQNYFGGYPGRGGGGRGGYGNPGMYYGPREGGNNWRNKDDRGPPRGSNNGKSQEPLNFCG